ncbi:MAG: hypothetical protein Ct9H300mP15_09250 [Gemmatimonadota bacterium]|nr:MAG: hypothetical protein Ct9H300mP15_09250 [Gemmatimonadota bacterium]
MVLCDIALFGWYAHQHFLMAGLVGALLGMSAQVGDLVISVFKREAG